MWHRNLKNLLSIEKTCPCIHSRCNRIVNRSQPADLAVWMCICSYPTGPRLKSAMTRHSLSVPRCVWLEESSGFMSVHYYVVVGTGCLDVLFPLQHANVRTLFVSKRVTTRFEYFLESKWLFTKHLKVSGHELSEATDPDAGLWFGPLDKSVFPWSRERDFQLKHLLHKHKRAQWLLLFSHRSRALNNI